MFAYVYFINDKQFSKVPVGFIKKFDKETYLATNIYKVFWSRHIHSLQNEFDEKCLSLLSELRDPPPKHSWKVSQGEGFYFAHILRIEDSIDSLITSLKLKRPAIPVTQCEEEISTTEDEVATLHIEKQNKKQEDAEMKHKENAGKRKRAKDIFEEAKRSRKAMFSKLDLENETDGFVTSDSDNDPEVIPNTMFRQLKASYDILEKEKEKADKKIQNLERKILQLEQQAENVDNSEVVQLRSLNRQLQERLLCLPTSQGECSCTAGKLPEIQEASDSETMEVELGGGISINRTVYKELFQLDHVRKFTKSLAVAIWGSATLAGRSVTGKVCKNRNGPKKAVSGATHPHPQQDSKPPLTPEKLAVISGQMREFLIKKGEKSSEIESAIKHRNRYLSDKIQDICGNAARVEAYNKSF